MLDVQYIYIWYQIIPNRPPSKSFESSGVWWSGRRRGSSADVRGSSAAGIGGGMAYHGLGLGINPATKDRASSLEPWKLPLGRKDRAIWG